MNIGNVEIPIVGNIESRENAEVTEIKDGFKNIDATPVKHEPEVDTLIITGFLNPEMHSQNYTLAEQKKDVKNLRKTDIQENTFDYLEYRGHLLIESVNFVDDSDSKIVNEVEIQARYFPWPKYYPDTTW